MLRDVETVATYSMKRELDILCRVASHPHFIESTRHERDALSIGNLAVLLLGMVKSYVTTRKLRAQPTWAISVLTTYQSLLCHCIDVKHHCAFVARLFGPANHESSLLNSNEVRDSLLDVG